MNNLKRFLNSAVLGVLLLAATPSCNNPAGEEPMNAGDDRSKIKILVAKLNSKDSDDRRRAAHDLGKIGSNEAVVPLVYALDDSVQGVRSYAAWALGQIGDSSAIDPLLAAWDKNETLFPPTQGRATWDIRCVNAYQNALCKLAGKDFGFDLKLWKKWRQEQVEKEPDKDK